MRARPRSSIVRRDGRDRAGASDSIAMKSVGRHSKQRVCGRFRRRSEEVVTAIYLRGAVKYNVAANIADAST
jgi:hypothetical protein